MSGFVPTLDALGVKHVFTRRLQGLALGERLVAYRTRHYRDAIWKDVRVTRPFSPRAHKTFFLFTRGRGREPLHEGEQHRAVFRSVVPVRAHYDLVQVLLVTVRHEAAGQFYGQVAQLFAVHGIRQVTDAVNLCEGLVGQVDIVELGRCCQAVIEGFVGIGDGRHVVFV